MSLSIASGAEERKSKWFCQGRASKTSGRKFESTVLEALLPGSPAHCAGQSKKGSCELARPSVREFRTGSCELGRTELPDSLAQLHVCAPEQLSLARHACSHWRAGVALQGNSGTCALTEACCLRTFPPVVSRSSPSTGLFLHVSSGHASLNHFSCSYLG